MPRWRLLALNIEKNRHGWAGGKRQLRQLLCRECPDVAALHEVLRPQGGGMSQADELAEGLGYRVGFSRTQCIRRPFPSEVGHAVLSRFPLREHRTEPLPAAAEREAALLYVLCSVKVGLLPLYVTQLDGERGPEAATVRRRQLAHISRYIAAEQAELPGRVPPHVRILPPILIGELGGPAAAGELAHLTEEAGFTEAAGAAEQAAERPVHLFIGPPRDAANPPLRVIATRLAWSQQDWSQSPPACAGLVLDVDADD